MLLCNNRQTSPTIFCFRLLAIISFLVACASEETESGCREDVATALGTADYLLYGLTANCDIFFATNVPVGADFNAAFGSTPINQGKNSSDDDKAFHCKDATLIPMKDTDGKLKLVITGTIERRNIYTGFNDHDREWQDFNNHYTYVYDFKLPPEGRWYTKTAFVHCDWRENPSGPDSHRSPPLWRRRYDQRYGDQCQASNAFAGMATGSEVLTGSVYFPIDSTLYVLREEGDFHGRRLTEGDSYVILYEYSLNGSGQLRDVHEPWPDLRSKREEWQAKKNRLKGWKMIKKSWEPFFADKLADIVVDQQNRQLYLVAAEDGRMKKMPLERALENVNLLYASQRGVVYSKSGVRNTTKLADAVNYRLHRRFFANQRFILNYDRFYGDTINAWPENETTEVFVVPIPESEDDVEKFGAGAKCIARLRQPPEGTDGGPFSMQKNFQLGALVGDQFRQVQNDANAGSEKEEERNVSACREDVAIALGTVDYLLYGLTADCDIFFAANVPAGADFNAAFGSTPIHQGKNRSDDEKDMALHCQHATLIPMRDSDGVLKLVITGAIDWQNIWTGFADHNKWYEDFTKHYTYVYDFKLPPPGQWYTKTKFVHCDYREKNGTFDWENPMWSRGEQRFGDHCQSSKEFAMIRTSKLLPGKINSYLPIDNLLYVLSEEGAIVGNSTVIPYDHILNGSGQLRDVHAPWPSQSNILK